MSKLQKVEMYSRLPSWGVEFLPDIDESWKDDPPYGTHRLVPKGWWCDVCDCDGSASHLFGRPHLGACHRRKYGCSAGDAACAAADSAGENASSRSSPTRSTPLPDHLSDKGAEVVRKCPCPPPPPLVPPALAPPAPPPSPRAATAASCAAACAAPSPAKGRPSRRDDPEALDQTPQLEAEATWSKQSAEAERDVELIRAAERKPSARRASSPPAELLSDWAGSAAQKRQFERRFASSTTASPAESHRLRGGGTGSGGLGAAVGMVAELRHFQAQHFNTVAELHGGMLGTGSGSEGAELQHAGPRQHAVGHGQAVQGPAHGSSPPSRPPAAAAPSRGRDAKMLTAAPSKNVSEAVPSKKLVPEAMPKNVSKAVPSKNVPKMLRPKAMPKLLKPTAVVPTTTTTTTTTTNYYYTLCTILLLLRLLLLLLLPGLRTQSRTRKSSPRRAGSCPVRGLP